MHTWISCKEYRDITCDEPCKEKASNNCSGDARFRALFDWFLLVHLGVSNPLDDMEDPLQKGKGAKHDQVYGNISLVSAVVDIDCSLNLKQI